MQAHSHQAHELKDRVIALQEGEEPLQVRPRVAGGRVHACVTWRRRRTSALPSSDWWTCAASLTACDGRLRLPRVRLRPSKQRPQSWMPRLQRWTVRVCVLM